MRYGIVVDEYHLENSGVWSPRDPESKKVEPETIVLVVAWALAVVQIVIGIVRGDAFGADRAIAIAFAVGCPLLCRASVLELVRRRRS